MASLKATIATLSRYGWPIVVIELVTPSSSQGQEPIEDITRRPEGVTLECAVLYSNDCDGKGDLVCLEDFRIAAIREVKVSEDWKRRQAGHRPRIQDESEQGLRGGTAFMFRLGAKQKESRQRS